MNRASRNIQLRLVGDHEAASGDDARAGPAHPHAPSRSTRASSHADAEARIRAAIASENRAAAVLGASDARWVVAVRASESLEGGRLAILRPEKRAHIARLATRLGLRPFDTSLIIAIVQDSARAGLKPLGRDTADRLRLVREAEVVSPEQRRRSAALFVLSIILIGLTLAAFAARWVLRA